MYGKDAYLETQALELMRVLADIELRMMEDKASVMDAVESEVRELVQRREAAKAWKRLRNPFDQQNMLANDKRAALKG